MSVVRPIVVKKRRGTIPGDREVGKGAYSLLCLPLGDSATAAREVAA